MAEAIDTESTSDDATSNDISSSERYGIGEADSDAEPSSSGKEELESVSDKKVGSRKPSKKVLETAANEVGDFNSQHHRRTRGTHQTIAPIFPH